MTSSLPSTTSPAKTSGSHLEDPMQVTMCVCVCVKEGGGGGGG